MFDCIIIGTGAAGVSAALTLKALNKSVLWLGRKTLSAKISAAEKIRNYPGLPFVSGAEMSRVFLNQVQEMGLEITERTVTGVYKMGEYYSVLCGDEAFEGKTVILATGVEAVKPIPGELEFVGRGVSYCATCDGFLYQDKTIFVLCTDKSMEHEIKYLADLAKKVYLTPLYREVSVAEKNIEILSEMPKQILGGRKVEKVAFAEKELSVDGVFMLKAAVAPAVLVGGIETENGHVKVNRSQGTNLSGLFAAGDCTGRPYQYAKAVGEGNVAAHAVVEFLKN